jgi:putative inorganic carbon (HCO3(-)) transporter
MAAGVFSRFAALILYLWFALFRPMDWVWFDISSLRLSLLIGLLLLVPCLLTGIFPYVSHGLSLFALLFFGCTLLAQTSAVNVDLGWMWIDTFGRLVTVSLLLISLITTPQRFYWVLLTVAVSFGIHPAKAGLVSILKGGGSIAEGIGGAFADNNGYAVGMVMIIPLLLAVAQNTRERWMRYGLYAAVPLSAVAVVATNSRGGFVGLAAAMMVWVLMQRRRATSAVLVTAVVAIGLAYGPISEDYKERLGSIKTYEQEGDASALGRLHFWNTAMLMVQDRPLGVGLRNYEVAYNLYDDSYGAFGRGRAVHSSHFQVLAEVGYPGITAYAMIFSYALYVAWRIRRRSFDKSLSPGASRFLFTVSVALMTSIVGFLVGGSFVSLALNDLTWVSFGMLVSLDRLSLKMLAQPEVPMSEVTLEEARAPVAHPDFMHPDFARPAAQSVARTGAAAYQTPQAAPHAHPHPAGPIRT